MLFDLQGKRRRGVQVIYTLLAVIMVGGLVLFGIGGAVSGGLLNAFQSGGQSTYQDQTDNAEKRLERRPDDRAALADLIEARYQLAVDRSTGGTDFSADGKRELAKIPPLWERYLQTKGEPDKGLVNLMLQVLGPDGLNQPEQAVTIAEKATEQQPSTQSFYQLSYLATLAGQTRKAGLAKRAALDRAKGKQERDSLKEAFKQIEAQQAAQQAQTQQDSQQPSSLFSRETP